MYSAAVVKRVFDVAWKCGKPPQEWKEAIIVPTLPIYMKGCRAECVIYKE